MLSCRGDKSLKNLYNFARLIKTASSKLVEKQTQIKEQAATQNILKKLGHQQEQEKKEEIKTSTFKKIFEKTQAFLMAQSDLPAPSMPQDIQRKCRQIIHKYPIEDLKALSDNYMKIYQLTHAREKPSSLILQGRRPFESTDNLVTQLQDKKDVIYLKSKHVTEEEIMEKNKLKKQKNLQQPKNQEESQQEKAGSKLTTQQSLIVYDQKLTVCNLLRKVPSSYSISKRIFKEINKRFPLFNPKTHLDFGSGLGPWAWSASEVFKIKSNVCVEPNLNMRKLAKFIKKDDESFVFYETLSHLVTLPFEQFDLISIGFVLEEIPNAINREVIMQSLWQKLSPGGVIVLCCPGSPMGFRFVNDFREMILKRNDFKILSPCPHHNNCPIAQKGVQWCHFSQHVSQWPKSVFPQSFRDQTIFNEKFSYIAIQKKIEDADTEIQKSETHQLCSDSQNWSRLVFKPLKKGGHFIIDICNNEGELERRIIAKSHGIQGGYHEIKRLRQGDLWRFSKWIPNKLKKANNKGKKLF